MTKREAKRTVCLVMAQELDNQLSHAGWINEYAETDDDIDRLVEAGKELVDELSRRGREFD